jgi:ferredoxin/protein involved in ribonucleotide reduction
MLMSITVFYFSATGNSLHVAKSIAGKLPECSLVSIAGLRNDDEVIVKTEGVGFVFPTHYFGLPPIVREFITKINLEQTTYSFAVVTSGSSQHLNSALTQAAGLFKKKGLTLNAGFHVNMISSYLPLSALPPEEKMQAKLAKADEKVQQITSAVLAQQSIIESEHFWRPFASINQYWRSHLLPQSHQKFYTTDACVSCGSCEKICPVANIRLEQHKPQWQNHCQECLACLHACPAQSIEFGSRTAGKRRYRHPQIPAADIIAAKEGQIGKVSDQISECCYEQR